ncbi:MAG TPA: LapA family protein [Burkholderiales bacterium]|jgi:lipopolysaccharide assembly protein A|nr:LapA family protein [Burkholderiales bacterium]
MRYVSWFFKIVLFLLLLGFAVKNTETTVLHYYLGYEWQAPLVLILLVFFCVGAAVGIMASVGYIVRQKRKMRALQRELKLKDRENEHAVHEV